MQPNEALAYLVQLAADFTNSLPPAARMPTQQAAQQAVDCLSQFLAPPAPPMEEDNVTTLPRKPK